MSKDRNNKKGFTLAEVLITLTIIGVVAALTIPSLLANVSDKTYVAKRKGFKTRMAQAISQIDAINAYEAKPPSGDSTDPATYARDNSSMNFITTALSKVYRISNVCEFDNFAACDFPNNANLMQDSRQIYTRDTKYFTNLNTNATAARLGGIDPMSAFFRTRNGESVQLYYNPRCIAKKEYKPDIATNWLDELCIYMIVDLDGAKKGPNQIGRDINFVSVFYSDAPYVVLTSGIHTHTVQGAQTSINAAKACQETTNYGFQPGESRIGSIEELCTLSVYPTFMGGTYVSGDITGPDADDYALTASAKRDIIPIKRSNGSYYPVCVLKDL